MTVLSDVALLVERLAPAPACDDCVAERLGLTARQHANQKTRELAGRDGFERRKDICSICGTRKFVVRKRPR